MSNKGDKEEGRSRDVPGTSRVEITREADEIAKRARDLYRKTREAATRAREAREIVEAMMRAAEPLESFLPPALLRQDMVRVGSLVSAIQKMREGEPDFRIRLTEEPLTPSTLVAVLSALTDLATQCWLIGHGRFADLIAYTQTRDVRFTSEAQFIFIEMTYHSPWEGAFKIDLSASNVAEAIVTAIDGVGQRRQRLEKAEIENRRLAQEVELARQKAEEEGKAARLEQERQALAVEQVRLEILEKRLDVQKKGIEYAFEIAAKTVAVLQPGADEQTKAMLIQTLLPTILQLQSGKEVTLVLPVQHATEEKPEGSKSDEKETL